ncbi:MAG: hydantoinase B/oxoprolinase family protein [Burkholderiales bacterium]|jgi:N-methylhydantoinase B/oxoprolinase/acetone carboxylase alpha subunit|nr:hydantoinase B/oxoprolinase family protein [Burkholderiales bacterium]
MSRVTDPVLLEVIRYRLESIVEEMQWSLIRGSFSPVVKEALDASCSLFDADGTVIAQSRSNPSHLGSLVFSVRSILAQYPVSSMEAGDVFIMNDPYLGGTHLPDIALVMPLVVDGRVVAMSASMAHQVDVGGIMAGSVPTHATEIFHEGLRLPALRLAHRGVIDDGLLRLIRQNVRMPDTLQGDLNAQLAAGKIALRRLAETGARYGWPQLGALFTELLDRSEAMTRKALAALPAGTYHYVDYLDNDGIDLDRRIRIEVAVTLDGQGNVAFDFQGTSAQVRGPLNIVPSGVHSAAFYGVRAITDPAIPTNGGCFRPVTVKLPPRSLVNPDAPAPVNGRTPVMKRIASCIVGALAQVLPERFPAASAASVLVLAFGGEWPKDAQAGTHAPSRRFVVTDLINGGSGAALGHDGIDGIATDMTNGMSLTAEVLELEAPIRLLRCAIRADSGGTGAFRGGCGLEREYLVLHGPVSISHRGERHYARAPGLAGGGDGALATSEILRVDGRIETVPSKGMLVLQAGDRLRVFTPGGGGYGPVAERTPEAIAEDLRSGKVTAGMD